MFRRIFKPSKTQSFFIFGARQTGKSTFLETCFAANSHLINLLEDKWESRYFRSPDRLIDDLTALKSKPDWIIIDEVQKIPKLLDIVHHLIEKEKLKFILTGSSARKLRRGSANLLAGRAFYYQMFPLTYLELGKTFDLDFVLNWGSLPKIFSLAEDDRNEYLRSYAQTYLREEILQEQIVRNSGAFRQFLEVAGQENGKTLNFSRLARDIDVDTKTVQSFFQILDDTLIGFLLPAYHHSTRKSVKQQPKFYLFDMGVKKALDSTLQLTITPKTSAFGQAFEHFIICESLRLNSYFRRDFQFYHYQTSAGGEIDLILRRGRTIIAVEIKSTSNIDEIEIRKLSHVADGLKATKKVYVSNDRIKSKVNDVICLPWQEYLTEVFVENKINL